MKPETQRVPLGHIRALLIAQEGHCAITGEPLSPEEVNADHIVPVSRKEKEPPADVQNVWLVSKQVNAAKGSKTYDEFVQLARLVVKHEKQTRELLNAIRAGDVAEVSKKQFDQWVQDHCEADGTVKTY